MWRILIISILCFLHLSLFAQANRIDSLKSRLESQQDSKKIALALLDLGKAYWQERNYAKAEENLQKAIAIFRKTKSYNDINDCFFILGRCYFDQAKYDKAIRTFTVAKDYAIEHHQDKNAANQYNAIGITNKSIGKYPEAVQAYHGALKIYIRLKHEKGMAAASHNLGLVYKNVSLDSALVYYQYALNLRQEKGSDQEVGHYQQSIASIYKDQKKYKQSLDFAHQAIVHFNAAKDSTGLINAYGVLGLVAFEQEHFLEAKETLQYVLTMAEPLKYNLANTYFSLGQVTQSLGKNHEAMVFFQKALDNSKFSESGNIRHQIFLAQSSLYEKMGQTNKALAAYKTHIALRDSIEGVTIKKQIKELDEKYQSEMKDDKIALLAKDNQITKRSRAIILGLFLISLLLGVVAWQIVRTKRLQTVQNNLELKQRLLRAQIRPHFLFNALTAIQAFTQKNGIDEGAIYLASFAKLMRSILENSSNEYVTIKDELESVGHYLKLEKLRHGDLFDYEISCDPDLKQDQLLIPPMLIQPFLENSIKHGFVGIDYLGLIQIDTQQESEGIRFSIQDNGIGIEHGRSPESSHKSRSLQITKDRLAMLNKKQKQPIKLEIIDLKKTNAHGTLVSFKLPLMVLDLEY